MNKDDTESQILGEIDNENLNDFNLKLTKLHLNYVADLISQRKKYAPRVYTIIVCWLIFIALVIVGDIIFDCCCTRSFLPSSILITLIGSTTVSVISLFAIILSNIFPRRHN